MGVLLRCHLPVRDCSALCMCPRNPHSCPTGRHSHGLVWAPRSEKKNPGSFFGRLPGKPQGGSREEKIANMMCRHTAATGGSRAQSHGDLWEPVPGAYWRVRQRQGWWDSICQLPVHPG